MCFKFCSIASWNPLSHVYDRFCLVVQFHDKLFHLRVDAKFNHFLWNHWEMFLDIMPQSNGKISTFLDAGSDYTARCAVFFIGNNNQQKSCNGENVMQAPHFDIFISLIESPMVFVVDSTWTHDTRCMLYVIEITSSNNKKRWKNKSKTRIDAYLTKSLNALRVTCLFATVVLNFNKLNREWAVYAKYPPTTHFP